jgi:hypothetical protein
MSFLLLIVEPPGQREARNPAEGEAVIANMLAYADELESRGVLRGIHALKQGGTRVTRRHGQVRAVNGPLAGTRELVGGDLLLDGVTRAQAPAIAAECPAATRATVEVRETGTGFVCGGRSAAHCRWAARPGSRCSPGSGEASSPAPAAEAAPRLVGRGQAALERAERVASGA